MPAAQVLGGAFAVNPASSRLAASLADKLQDTIEVADVHEEVGNTHVSVTTACTCVYDAFQIVYMNAIAAGMSPSGVLTALGYTAK